MTMPPEIAYASRQFMDLLGSLKKTAGLQTHNQCYAMLRAVLHEFRAHLTIEQAIGFADALPPLGRAIFIEDWQPTERPASVPSRQAFADAVERRLSPHHVPPERIADAVFAVLNERADARKMAVVHDSLPAGLAELCRSGADVGTDGLAQA